MSFYLKKEINLGTKTRTFIVKLDAETIDDARTEADSRLVNMPGPMGPRTEVALVQDVEVLNIDFKAKKAERTAMREKELLKELKEKYPDE